MSFKSRLPSGLNLRAAEAPDHGVISELVSSARLNPMGLDWRRFTLVEDADGEVVACGQIKPHRDGSRELASLVVAEPWRGKGIGSAVVHALMADQGPPLYLMCRSSLMDYYARFGFEELTPEMEQPPYFQRVRRLFGKLVDWMASDGSHLAIMEWPG